MPCYRCGTRQADPEAGKSSPWRRGVVREHQVLICPACHPAAVADLTRCARCGSAHLIRRLDQVECLDCRLIRDAEPETPAPPRPGEPSSRDPSASSDTNAPPGFDAPPGTSAPPGASAPPGTSAPPGASAPDVSPGARDLAAEVARALDRVLGRR